MPSDNAEVIAHDTRACGLSVKKQPVTCHQKPLSPAEIADHAAVWRNEDAGEEKASSSLLLNFSKQFKAEAESAVISTVLERCEGSRRMQRRSNGRHVVSLPFFSV